MENFKGGKKSNNENELNPEMGSGLKTSCKKQLPPNKNFMNPTISATIKVSIPKKKILGERNETLTLDSLEQTSRSASFGSKLGSVSRSTVDCDDDLVGKPYDPVNNYLSPRPKFLRYNPNRRRKMLNLQENDEDRVKISTYFGIPSPGSQSGMGSSITADSCSQEQESAEEAHDVNAEEYEDDEEEMVEFEEERCSLKGFFKFLFVVIALVLTTRAICSMNSPSHSRTLEWDNWRDHVYGLNFSGAVYGPISESVLLVERLKEEDAAYGRSGDQKVMFETIEEFVDEAQNDESNVIQNEILQDHEIEAMEIDYVEAETDHDFNQDGLVEEDDSDASENNPQSTNDVEFETANDMEDGAEEEFDDMKTNDPFIKFTSFDLTTSVVIGHILILTSFIVIHCSKLKKSSPASFTPLVEKEEFKDLEPSPNPQSMTMMQQKETYVPISEVHIPSVELLGEFVFGEEITSNTSAETYSTTDSHTIKKQTPKKTQVVTPSPVRRSSRLKTRPSVMSP